MTIVRRRARNSLTQNVLHDEGNGQGSEVSAVLGSVQHRRLTSVLRAFTVTDDGIQSD